jgi:DNA-directed RNA polymerase subunit RPC12/RpoP
MAIVIRCSTCSVRLTLGEDRAGTELDCPKCRNRLRVPHHPPAPVLASAQPQVATVTGPIRCRAQSVTSQSQSRDSAPSSRSPPTDSYQNTLRERVEGKRAELKEALELRFLVQPCFRCHEFAMRLLSISPNGRSIHYQCLNCKKKTHSAAGTPDASEVLTIRNAFQGLLKDYGKWFSESEQPEGEITFEAPPAPLPYEQTTRAPIPEAVKGQVWRRDAGRCVKCGTKQNLQFDHIIPVAEGGATVTANLQLLCQTCNRSKGKKI